MHYLKRIFYQFSCWERWPFALIYAPLSFIWLYYMIKARSIWFFSNVNPTLEFAGFEGENKKEMYDQLPKKFIPHTLFISHNENISVIKRKITYENISYPFVVKPQVGMHALLFRKIENSEQLEKYHAYVYVDYIIQQYVDLPVELSVFHIRYPNEKKGEITGFISKNYLSVTGDGVSTLHQLINKNCSAKHKKTELKKHGANLNLVLPDGEQYFLSIAGNHNRGAKFVNLHAYIDDQLSNVFDRISNEAGYFYFGRYDLKCASIEDLKAGKNFYILEFNGAGAEPNHIYDCGMSYWNAIKIIKMHWQHLYRIGRINLENGIPYWSFRKGFDYLKNAKMFFKKMRVADVTLPAWL
jgi:hypothetical protein